MMISVIVPVLNEATGLAALLAVLARETTAHEVIVVDGGSWDGSALVAQRARVRLLTSPPGRGQQIHSGASKARGDVLLVLHADSQFPRGGLAAIESRLAALPHCPGGNFRLTFPEDRAFCRWLTGFYAWLRSHGFYYGDSGVFARREVFDAIGGVRPIALMEDYEFVRRLEAVGETCVIDTPSLATSGRRFEARHPLAIVGGWLMIHALFHLRVPPHILAWLYNSRREAQAVSPQGIHRTEETSI